MRNLPLLFVAFSLVLPPGAQAVRIWPFGCRAALIGDHLLYLPGYKPATVEALESPLTDRVVYPHGVTATLTSTNIDQIVALRRQGGMDFSAINLDQMRRSASTIRVTRGEKSESFARENRSLAFYRNVFFPPELLNAKALQGKRVFDAGCGSAGKAVKEMRDEGITAFGGDIYIDEARRTSPHLVMLDLLAPPLADNQFDLVLAGYGPLSYPDEVPVEIRQAILKQLFRMSRPTGGVLISPYDIGEIETMVKALRLNATVEEVRGTSDDGRSVQAAFVKKKMGWLGIR